MPVRIRVSEVIDRPVGEVFQFHAVEHVQNHPRWDPDIQLEQITEGPIGRGTVIKRVNTRSGHAVEGRMEVVEFVPNQAVGMVIHDGPVQMKARVSYIDLDESRTTLTYDVQFLNLVKPLDEDMLKSQMQRSLRNVKQLVEARA